MRPIQIAIVSDIHYASAAEKLRGNDYEYKDLANPLMRLLLKWHRRYVWLKHPLEHNGLLDHFLEENGAADFIVALGDYSCDSAFVGVSDEAACDSARECLAKLRKHAGRELFALLGDHELGKFSLVGRFGGMRLESWSKATGELQIQPFWTKKIGCYVLMGVTSSLLALPLFDKEILASEREQWMTLRERQLLEVRNAFATLEPAQKVILFCHDPTALPFLWSEPAVQARIGQIEQTLIGHLHSHLILRESRMLAGMPVIKFLGHSAERLSSALHDARYWRRFNVRLCPSLAGIELLKDGGFYTAEIDPAGGQAVEFTLQRIRRR